MKCLITNEVPRFPIATVAEFGTGYSVILINIIAFFSSEEAICGVRSLNGFQILLKMKSGVF